jgi:hypothetical protein
MVVGEQKFKINNNLKEFSMKKNILKKGHLIVLLIWISLLSFLFIGCKKSSEIYDANMVYLNHRFMNTPDENDRFQLAIKKYQNKTLDPEPILLLGWIREDRASEIKHLVLGVYDEDCDIQGFMLKEETLDPNGTVNILEEEYPVFVHYPLLLISSSYMIPISVRNYNQRKNDKEWRDYISMNLDALKEMGKMFYDNVLSPNLLEKPINPTELLSEMDIIQKQWEQTLPIVWISNPEPNHINIWIQVYDEAGNRSNIIKLIEN